MRLIGHVRQLQIQKDALKRGEGAERVYDLDALSIVPAARFSSDGVTGLVDGKEVFDVHHRLHKGSRHRSSSAISFNFMHHYEQMDHQFGSGVSLGCGGENMIIELIDGEEELQLVEEPGLTLAIETEEASEGYLSGISVAKPCVPFSEFLLDTDTKPNRTIVKETLQFLDGGMRGFYGAWEGEPLVVRVGDKVVALE